MKEVTTLLIALFGCLNLINAQAVIFSRTYGGDPYDDARSVVATADGSYVFTGLHKDSDYPGGTMYLTKVNAAGAVLWTRYFDRDKEDGGNHVLACSDGGFLITGHTALTYGESCDGYVVKTDRNGMEQWRTFIGSVLDDVCDAAVELPGGEFLVAGRTEEPESRTFRMLLARIGTFGRVIFQKTLPSVHPSVAYSMALGVDEHLYLAGYQYDVTGQVPDRMLLVKCTPEGDLFWSRDWGSAHHERARAVLPAPDGGCFVAGGGHDVFDLPQSMAVFRFDAAGKVLSHSEILNNPGLGGLYGAVLSAENGLTVAGVLRPKGVENYEPFVAHLNADLQTTDWQKLPMTPGAHIRCIANGAAGGVAIGGNEPVANQKAKACLAVVRPPGVSLSVQDANSAAPLFFPNPFSEFTYLKAGMPGEKKHLRVFSTDGRLVREAVFQENEYFMHRDGLPAGLFFAEIRTDAGKMRWKGKLVVGQ